MARTTCPVARGCCARGKSRLITPDHLPSLGSAALSCPCHFPSPFPPPATARAIDALPSALKPWETPPRDTCLPSPWPATPARYPPLIFYPVPTPGPAARENPGPCPHFLTLNSSPELSESPWRAVRSPRFPSPTGRLTREPTSSLPRYPNPPSQGPTALVRLG